MYNTDELTQRLAIIKNSSINDVEILDKFYTTQVRYCVSPAEEEQFVVLRYELKHRMVDLGEVNG